MIIDMPSTTANAVAKRLVDLRDLHGAVALGRVLTLVIVTDEQHAESAIESANHASHEHPCRIVAVVRGTARGSARLDAQIRVGGDAGASEVVVHRLFGPLTAHPASVVIPLLLPDAPVVAWWPGEAPERPADDPVGRLAQRRITDAAACARPIQAIGDRASTYTAGDTDLAWTRITLWRAVIAASVEQGRREKVTGVRVVGAPDSPSADLLAAWLMRALRCPTTRVRNSGVDGLVSVRLDRTSGPLEVDRPDEENAVLRVPGSPERKVALPKRLDRDCLAEELRRLDPDEVYGEVLTKGLALLREKGRMSRTRRKVGV
ncbi:MAG TPA: glucose-6-phosphate dehydrogenase assembly protein OpcA [Jiangellales bacterium]|nr:glucose-6-phosphate dehydrogenase assembly protein OpcA [Jiangellales bacterium]